jgi:hypothetical protein
MAIIYSYPIATPQDTDLLIISRTPTDPDEISNYSVDMSSVADYVIDEAFNGLINSAIYEDINGRIGIGTTSPNEKLSVQGGGFSMFADGGTAADAFAVTTHIYTFSDENEDIVYSYDGTKGHEFSTQGSQRLYIKQNGNIGIGTSSPAEKLHVVGSTLIEGSSVELKVEGSGSYDTANITMGNAAKADTFEISLRQDPGDNYATLDYDGYSPTGTSHVRLGANYLDFNTAGSSRMRIDSSGNVGIGTTSPTAKLYVGSSSNSNNNLLTMESSGPVWAHLKTPSNSQSQIGFGDTQFANQNTRGRIVYNSSTTTANNYMSFTTNFAEVMRITNSNVGIGTTSPTRALDVSKSGSTILANFKNTGGTSSFISLGNTSSTADQIRLGSNETALTLSTNYAERMRIDFSGNVGIGTTSPGSRLQVDGEIDANGGDGYRIFGRPWAVWFSDLLTLGDWDGEGYATRIMDSDSNEAIRIIDSGKVGIGTASPASKLEVDGGDIEIDDSASGLILRSPNGTRYRVQVDNSGNLTTTAI